MILNISLVTGSSWTAQSNQFTKTIIKHLTDKDLK